MGLQWRASLWRLGCVALSEAHIDTLDQAAPSRAGVKRGKKMSHSMMLRAILDFNDIN
jgi:hypothetical protein